MSDRVLDALEETARVRLAGLSYETAPVQRVHRAIRRARARRAGVALAVVGVLAVAVVVTSSFIPNLSARLDLPGSTIVVDEVGRVDIEGVTWAVAGRLASDLAFVSGAEENLAKAPASAAAGCGAAPQMHVLFADDISGMRIVVARAARGCWWVGEGPAGTPAGLLATRAGVLPDARGPTGVLVPSEGPNAVLVLLAPLDTTVELATMPTLWPDPAPRFSASVLPEGTSETVLGSDGPFRPTESSVAIRGRSSTDRPDGVVIGYGAAATVEAAETALTDEQHDELVRFVATVPASIQDIVRRAALAAKKNGGFGHGKLTFTLVAAAPDAAVVDVVQDGVRSRASNAGNVDSSEDRLLSWADEADPRPVTTYHRGSCLRWQESEGFTDTQC